MRKIVAYFAIVALLMQILPVYSASAAPGNNGQAVVTSVLQETDPSVAITGWWYPDTDNNYSGGSAKFTKDHNATVAFTFTGNGFRYKGSKTQGNDKLYIYVDGALYDEVKPSSWNVSHQQVLYETMDLAYGTHQVEVRLRKKNEDGNDNPGNGWDNGTGWGSGNGRDGFQLPAEWLNNPAVKDAVYGNFNAQWNNNGWLQENERLQEELEKFMEKLPQLRESLAKFKDLFLNLFSTNVDSIEILTLAPAAPTAPQVSLSGDAVTLQWSAVQNAMGYNVFRSTSINGTPELIGGPIANGATFTDSIAGMPRDKDVKLYYFVSAIGAANYESPKSAAGTITLPKIDNIPVPTGLTVTVNQHVAKLQWNSVNGVQGYNIYRAPAGSTSYEKINNNAISQNSYSDASLAQNQFPQDVSYSYLVTALRGGKESARSAAVTAVFPKKIVVVKPATPSKPDVKYGNDVVTVQWSSVPNAQGYMIYRSTKSNGTADFVGGPVLNSTTFIDPLDGIERHKDIKLYYTITALGSEGYETAKSQEASVTAPKYNVPAPTNLTASVSGHAATLQWDTVSGASEYKVYRALAGDPLYQQIASIKQNKYTDTSLSQQQFPADTSYNYAVSAVRGGKDSGKSTPATAIFPKNTVDLPGVPTGLVAHVQDDQTVVVAWAAEANATGYNVYRSLNNSDYSLVAENLTSASYTDSTYVGQTIVSNVEISYKVLAVAMNGAETGLSAAATVVIAKNIELLELTSFCSPNPQLVQKWKVTNTNSFAITFTVNVEGSTHQVDYVVEENDELFFETTTVSGVNKVSIYVNGIEHDSAISSGEACVVGVPTELQAEVVGQSVTLTWSIVEGAVGYKVYRSISGEAEVLLNDQSLIETGHYEDALGLADIFTPYTITYSISAINSDGIESSRSSSIEVRIKPVHQAEPFYDDERNMLENPSFETVASGINTANNWFDWAPEGVTKEVSLVNAPAASGDRAHRISGTGLMTGTPILLFQDLQIDGGMSYTFYGKLYVEDLQNAVAQLYVEFYNADRVAIGSGLVEIANTSKKYTVLKTRGFAPPDAISARVFVVLRGTGENGSGTFYVDDINLSKNDFLSNSDFEAGSLYGLGDGWTAYASDGVNKKLEIISVSSGERAQKMEADGLYDGASLMIFQDIAVEENKRFEVGGNFNIFNLDMAKVQLYVDFYNSEGTLIGLKVNERDVKTEGYEYLGIQDIVPIGARSARVYAILRGTGANGAGSVIVDSFDLNYSEGIMNPDFELHSAPGNIADYWKDWAPDGVNKDVQIVHDPVYSGKNAKKISATNLTSGTPVMVYQDIQVDGGKPYALTGKLKVDSIHQAVAQLYVEFYDKSWKNVGAGLAEKSETTQGYFTLKKIGVIPNDATSARVYTILRGTGQNGSGVLYVDDIHFMYNDQLVNADFEEYSVDGLANGWSVSSSEGISQSLQVLHTPGLNGYSQKISVEGLYEGASLLVYQDLGVQDNKRFVAGGNFLVDSINGALIQLYIDFYNASDELVGLKVAEINSTTNGFERLEIQDVVPINAVRARLYAVIRGEDTNASASVFIDSFNWDYISGLRNSDFENSSTGNMADQWRVWAPDGVIFDVHVVEAPVVSREKALKVSGLVASSPILVFQDVQVVGGKSYNLSGKFNVENLNQAVVQLYIELFDEKGQMISSGYAEQSTAVSEYTLLMHRGFTPEHAKSARIYAILRGQGPEGSGTFYVDDIKFKQ
jgi:fibronectin type 3 domain-containing protein